MKIAIISDIHGNIEALEAVLKDIAAGGPWQDPLAYSISLSR
jgi:hypothetical protein